MPSKEDIKATQSFPKQTLITDKHRSKTDISNLSIKHTEIPQTHNRHTVVDYTDILDTYPADIHYTDGHTEQTPTN